MTPGPTLTEEDAVARLTVVTGAGEFGAIVLDLLEGQIDTLPDALQWATGLVRLADGDADTVGALADARDLLTRLPNTNRIEESNWQLAGGEKRRVRHFVAAPAHQAEALTRAVAARLGEEAVDPYVAILRCDDPADLSDVDLRPWSSVFLLADENRLGETVAEEDVAGAAAGAILLSLLCPLLDRVGERTPVASFGFAGRYGLSGPAFHRLAARTARGLVDEHAVSVGETDDSLSQEARSLLETHDPRTLGERLFDRELQRRGAPVRGGPSEEPIPAVVEWEDETLTVDLQRGSLGQEATPPGEEDRWPTQIRRFARTWEMTRSFAWRRRLGAAGRALSEQLRENLPDAFGRLLREVPRAPSEAERTADRLDELADRKHQSEPVRDGDLEEALSALEQALESRSSPGALGARLALWSLPAIVASVPVVQSLYEGFRGVLFPVAFGGLAAGAVLAWYLWRVIRDRNRVLDARNEALTILERRWEGLLAEAAVRSLQDEVLPALRSTLTGEVRDRLEACRSWLAEVRRELDEMVDARLLRLPTFAPVLDRDEEFDRLIDELGLGPENQLDEAVQAELLDPAYGAERTAESLKDWCAERADDALVATGLGFDDLWTIRLQARADEDGPGPTAERLWRFAEPLAGDARITSGDEISLVTVPPVLAADLRDTARRDGSFPADRVKELSSAPLMACFRAVPLEIRGVEVA